MLVQRKTGLGGLALLFVAGCSAVASGPDAPEVGKIGDLPPAVLELAGPGQDLSTARLMPEDNCYWYLRQGPVETTLLPLRTANGNPICLRRTE